MKLFITSTSNKFNVYKIIHWPNSRDILRNTPTNKGQFGP